MKVHNDLSSLPHFKNAIVTMGAFDGVHKGHQQIIQRMKQLALNEQGETIIITFHPHPRKVISSVPGEIKQLTNIKERIQLLEVAGIDHLVIINFDYQFSNRTAEQYVEDFLYQYFKPNTVIVGYDHHFGKGRNGNIELLKTMGARLHFKVEEINEQLVQNEIISSTLIRNYISDQQIKKANDLLGYAYQFEGFVVRGNQLGRTIGYPTANLHINDEEKLIPANGVYAVKVKGACTNHELLEGMMNIGIRPTVDGQKKVIEVNIFNFDQDIYEQYLTVLVYEFIRGEVKFNGLDALKNQLHQDKITASAMLE
ncbi:MAG: bifunctional riboflavin kinase/FAD synthetase [Chitinophagia bacterium]